MSITDITFDARSIGAIEDIKRRNNLTLVLSRIMPYGTIANIFLGNGVLESSFNIYSTDFEALAKAMAALPAIQRKVVRDIASFQALSHSGKEARFWRGIAEGCSID